MIKNEREIYRRLDLLTRQINILKQRITYLENNYFERTAQKFEEKSYFTQNQTKLQDTIKNDDATNQPRSL